MPRCPITYEDIPEGTYSRSGLRRLSRRLTELQDLPFTPEELRREALARASKMSIQGVQPKLSAILNVPEHRFEIVDRGGRYILNVGIRRTIPVNRTIEGVRHMTERHRIPVAERCLMACFIAAP